jgi:NAD(P)-dependent dehydrogenase (short-subunit alcohol dehydrogenase family)
MAITLDVLSPVEVAAAVEQALAVFAQIDILVNNAGAAPGADRVPVVDLEEAEWDRVLDTNTKGAFLCSRGVAAAMIHRGAGGRIINMSSDCGKLGFANKAAYCASKFTLIGFTQALAMELAPFGITVNAICPGLADTDRIDYFGRTMSGEFDERRRAEEVARRGRDIPLGRVATVEDVAQVTALLASPEAAYLTGQAINVSGGAIMH